MGKRTPKDKLPLISHNTTKMAPQKKRQQKQHQCKIDAETTRTRGTTEPRPVLGSLVLNYRAQLIVDLTTAAPSHDVTFAEIMAKVPGGATTWPKCRITHYEAWGGDAAGATTGTNSLTLRVRTQGSEEFGGDNASFTDYGTFGAQRAHVSIRPGMFQRLQWADGSAVNPALTISSDVVPSGTSNRVVLQVSLELRSLSL